MEGDPKKAATLFDDATTKDPGDALALTGQILMAQRLAASLSTDGEGMTVVVSF